MKIQSYLTPREDQQPPLNPKPSNPITTQKRKALDPKFELESRPTTKRPTIKIEHPQSQPTLISPPKPREFVFEILATLQPKPFSSPNAQESDVEILKIPTLQLHPL